MNVNPNNKGIPSQNLTVGGNTPAKKPEAVKDEQLFEIAPNTPDAEPEISAKGIGYKDALVGARDKNKDGKVDWQEGGGTFGFVGTFLRYLFTGKIEKTPKEPKVKPNK